MFISKNTQFIRRVSNTISKKSFFFVKSCELLNQFSYLICKNVDHKFSCFMSLRAHSQDFFYIAYINILTMC